MHSGIKSLGLFVSLLSAGATAAPKPPATPLTATTPLQFVQNYVRQLATFEDLREDASKELDADKTQAPMDCIHAGTRYDLEVNAAINMLHKTRLVGVSQDLQKVPQMFADLYAQRQQVMAQMTKVCSAFAEGPKPGVDYAALATLMPKIRAQLEYLDNTAFEASPLVFATLISDVPDSQGHASHLVISCDDRKRLVDQIDSSFRAKLAEKKANFGVSQAQLFRTKLLEFKCAEEPR
jgi:hypothetical protein